MGKTIAQIRSDISRKLHGTNINKIQGEFEIYAEASREVLNDIDFYETKRIQQITNNVYASVYDYTLPTDLKGNRIIDIRPQANRNYADFVNQNYSVEFDRYKTNQTFNIRDNSGLRTLRLSTNLGTSVVIHNCDSVSDNGTWTADDDTTNVRLDTNNYIKNSGSIVFDVDGSGTVASIYNDDLEEVDLEDYENTGAFFCYIYCPVTITDATLYWGNDNANYWEDTITAPHYNTFQVGWNLIRFDWNGSTETGTPTTDITYLKLSITYDGNVDTDYRLSEITCNSGNIYEIEYYSKYLFKDNAGNWIEEPTVLTDEIVLNSEGYNCFLYKVLELIAPQVQAEDAGFDYTLYDKKYQLSKFSYVSKYKSEIRLPIQTYYTPYERL